MTHLSQARRGAKILAASAFFVGSGLGCGAAEFAVPISFVVPDGHDSFADLDFVSLQAAYGDGRSYEFWLQAPSSGTEWNIPQLPAGFDVQLHFAGLVSDGLGGDGQVIASSGSAGPLAFDPETPASARVLFTRRGRTGTLPGGSHGALEPEVIDLPDGRVLALGGASGFSEVDPDPLDNASIFAVDGTEAAWEFADAERMRGGRMDFAAVLVQGSGTEYDGKVVVVGTRGLVEGRDGIIITELDEDALEDARDVGMPEVFDPEDGTWSDLAGDDVMRTFAARGHHQMVQLGDELWVTGGIIFDDGLGLRASADTMRIHLGGDETEMHAVMDEGRWRHTATKVGGDRMLVVGGAAVPTSQTTFPEVALVEIYDAGDDTWYSLGDLEPGRSDHVAVRLPDGRVLIAGGVTALDTEALAETWLVDPADGSWERGPDLTTARGKADARLLDDGRVVICGGETALFEPVADCEIWTLGTDGLGAWAPTPDPADAFTPRIGARTALLGSGEVLVVGGQSGVELVSDVVVYRP